MFTEQLKEQLKKATGSRKSDPTSRAARKAQLAAEREMQKRVAEETQKQRTADDKEVAGYLTYICNKIAEAKKQATMVDCFEVRYSPAGLLYALERRVIEELYASAPESGWWPSIEKRDGRCVCDGSCRCTPNEWLVVRFTMPA